MTVTATAPGFTLRGVAAPGRLWRVYLLILVTVVSIGSAAGEALFITGDFGDIASAQDCLLQWGIPSPDLADPATDSPAYTSCLHGFNQVLGWTALIGGLALPVVVLVLMLVGGLAIRWRLRRAAAGDVPGRLSARFEVLCDSQVLTGRRRPRLVVAPPVSGVHQAFTIAVPGARPWVVVPLGYGYADATAFDAVVIHELGHVRARDVLWASAAWWAGWVVVPALLVALVPLAGDVQTFLVLYWQALVTAVLGAVLLLVLRASLLRSRELAADEHVRLVTDDRAALTALVGTGPAAVGRSWVPARLRRLFATHPPAAQRLAGVPSRDVGGFTASAATGVVAMVVHLRIYALLRDFLNGPDADTSRFREISLIAAGLLWAVAILPSWTRRAAGGAGWRGPIAGAVVGLLVGYCVAAPGATPWVTDFYGDSLVLLLLCLGLSALAVGLLTAAVAARLAQPARNRRADHLSRWGGAAAVALALFCLWFGASNLTTFHKLDQNWASARLTMDTLAEHASDPILGCTPVLILLGLALVSLRGRDPGVGRTTAVITIGVGIGGGVTALVSALLRFRGLDSQDLDYFWHAEKMWVCCLTGLAVFWGVLLARRGGTTLAQVPAAITSALLATVTAGAIQFTALRVQGREVHYTVFEQSVRTPAWLLLLTLSATALLTLVLVRVIPRPSADTGSTRWVVGTAAIAGLAVLALLTGRLSWVTVAENDYSIALAANTPDNQIPAAAPGETHGPVLDDAGAETVLDSITPALPAEVEPVENAPTPPPVTATPRSCDTAMKDYAALTAAKPRAGAATRSFELPVEGLPVKAQIVVTVTSYAGDPPDVADYDRKNKACAQYSTPDARFDGGVIHLALHAGGPSDLPYPALHTTMTLTGEKRGNTFHVVSRGYLAVVGHDEVEVAISWAYGGLSPGVEVNEGFARLAEQLMDRVVTAL